MYIIIIYNLYVLLTPGWLPACMIYTKVLIILYFLPLTRNLELLVP